MGRTFILPGWTIKLASAPADRVEAIFFISSLANRVRAFRLLVGGRV
jgi:hypothetical protein